MTLQDFPEARIGAGNTIRVSRNTVSDFVRFHGAIPSRAVSRAGDAIVANTDSAAEGLAISEVLAALKVGLAEAGEGCSTRVISSSSF